MGCNIVAGSAKVAFRHPWAPVFPCKQAIPFSSSRRSKSVVVAAKQPPSRPRARGYVEEDNSGRANIFGTEPRMLYTRSPTAEAAARQGIGGLQGAVVLGIAIALVAAVTLGMTRLEGGQSLEQVQSSGSNLESLGTLAQRIKASL
eukprot:jgi/Botrbrau1/2964/Bobra.0026s0032.1